MEEIGLAAIFDSSEWTDGVEQYNRDIEVMNAGTEEAEEKGTQFGDVLGGIADIAGGALVTGVGAAVGAVTALTGELVAATMAATSDEAMMVRQDFIYQQLGRDIGMTQEQLADYATQMSKTGVFTEDATVQAETMLMKFDQISGETFPKALDVMADYAAITGTDLPRAAMLFGRSLNRPESAMRLLTQAGIKLTDEKKKEITALVKAGNVQEAQGAILDMLAEKYQGGVEAMSETAGAKMAALKDTIGEMQDAIGLRALPAVQELFSSLLAFVETPQVQAVFTWLSDTISDFAGFVSRVVSTLTDAGPGSSEFAEALSTMFGPDVYDAIQQVIGFIEELWNWLSVNLPPAIEWLSDLWTNTLLPGLMEIGEYLITTFGPVLQKIWDFLGVFLPQAGQVLATVWQNILLPVLQLLWTIIENYLWPALKIVGEIVATVLVKAFDLLMAVWQNALFPAITWLSMMFNEKLLPAIKAVAEFLGGVLVNALGAVQEAINWLGDVIDWIIGLFEKLGEAIPDWLKPGSPPPLQIGLEGINKELATLANIRLPELETQLRVMSVMDNSGITSPVIGQLGSSTTSSSKKTTNNYLYGPQFSVNDVGTMMGILESLQ